MFVKAVETVGGYTRPVFTIARRYDSSEVVPGCGNLFFINEDGWALTTRHTAKIILRSGKLEENYRQFRADRDSHINDDNFSDELHFLEIKYRMGGKNFAQMKVNFFDCINGLTGFETKISGRYDLAAIHMMGFKETRYRGHAIFAENPRVAMPGKMLCRLGYPFPEFQNYEYDPEADDIRWTESGHKFTSRFPAEGMMTRLAAEPGGTVVGIEINAGPMPGLNGAPLFDERGLVYGMQTGFNEKHLTHCLHVDRICEFLQHEHIPYYTGDINGNITKVEA